MVVEVINSEQVSLLKESEELSHQQSRKLRFLRILEIFNRRYIPHGEVVQIQEMGSCCEGAVTENTTALGHNSTVNCFECTFKTVECSGTFNVL